MDPRTTVLIGGITSGLMAVVLTMLARATPLPVPGLRFWVGGGWLVFTALVLLGLRDWISHVASVTLGNSALILAYIAWLAGTQTYLGSRFRWPWWLAAWAAAMAGVSWFIFGDPSFRVRVVLVTGLCTWISVIHALVLLRHPRADPFGKTIGVTLTASWLMILGLVYCLRGMHAIALPQGDTGLLTQDNIQIIYTGCFTVCNLMLVIGFATMASDHVRVRIEEEAVRDPLTGALNRKALFECLARERSRSLRTSHTFSVAMLDVDHFKKINDRHGHPVGDQVLVQLCRRIKNLVRPHDVFARYGGEEFAIVMPETGMASALQAAHRILGEAVKTDDPALPAFTVSIGLAQWHEKDESIEALMARADSALYAAKTNGRNRVEIASQPTPPDANASPHGTDAQGHAQEDHTLA